MGCGSSSEASDPNNNEKATKQSRPKKTAQQKTGQSTGDNQDRDERGALPVLKDEPEIEDVSFVLLLIN